VLITSARPGDGKTLVASNLGIVTALSRRSAVVLDADLRHPAIAELLRLAPGPGIVDVCNGDAPLEQALVKTELATLSVLQAGAAWPMAAELLGSKEMGDLLAQLRERFDLVIVDSPPVGAVADACILCRIVERTVLVVRAGSRSPEPEHKALQSLENAGANILGIVVNDILPRDSMAYRQYYAYR
jgi:capsular exopolysaccharide synthesis family protein